MRKPPACMQKSTNREPSDTIGSASHYTRKGGINGGNTSCNVPDSKNLVQRLQLPVTLHTDGLHKLANDKKETS